MKTIKELTKRTKIILLSHGVVALVCLILCLVNYPFDPKDFNDEVLSYYYDTAAIKQWYSASLPKCVVDVRSEEGMLIFSDIGGKCDTVKYQAVGDSAFRFAENDSVGKAIFVERMSIAKDSDNRDSVLTVLVKRCVGDTLGYAFCGLIGDSLTFVRHDEMPNFTFDFAMLTEKLKSDTDYTYYGNVYAFMVGEKILEAYEAPDGHTYGKEDFKTGEGKFLCTVNPERLAHKPITAEESSLWVVFLALSIYSVLTIIFFLIMKTDNKKVTDEQSEFDKLYDEKETMFSEILADEKYEKYSEQMTLMSLMMDAIEKLKKCKDEGSLRAFMDNTLRSFMRDMAGASATMETVDVMCLKAEYFDKIVRCRNANELNAVFNEIGRQGDFRDMKMPRIETPESVIARIETPDKISARTNDPAKMIDGLVEAVSGEKGKRAKAHLAYYKSCEHIYKNNKEVLERLKKSLRGKDSEMKADEVANLIIEEVTDFEKSSKALSDFVAFAENVTGKRYEEATAKAELLDETEAAKARYLQFLEENEIGDASDMDAMRIYDFVRRLCKEHAKPIAEKLGCKSVWFEKEDVLFARLRIFVGCYGICKNLNEAYKNKKECEFGNEVETFAKENKLMAELKDNMLSMFMDARAYGRSEEFVKTMYERFVKGFRNNVRDKADKGWFFENVLNIAYHSADFIAFMAAKTDSITYYPNYRWLVSGFDKKMLDKFVHDDVRYSNSYSNRIYEWTDEVGVRRTEFIVDNYQIKP